MSLSRLPHNPMLLACLLLLPAGCGSNPLAPPGYVAKQWATSFRELQLTPIFPPREDVQVGDIYIVPVAPGKEEEQAFADKGYLPRGMWVHSLDLNVTLSAFYSQRADFPATNVERFEIYDKLISTEMDEWPSRERLTQITESVDIFQRLYPEHPQPEARHDLWIGQNPSGEGGNGNTRRLRLVGFPEFMSATFTQGDLSAFIPASAGSIGLQATFSDAKSVTVKVPVAESYGLPMSLMRQPLIDQQWNEWDYELDEPIRAGGSPFDNIGDFIQADKRRRDVITLNGVETEVEIVRLRISTEVYYARVLEVTIEATREAAAALQAAEDAAGQSLPRQVPESTPGPPSAPDATGAQRADDLDRRLLALESAQSSSADGGASVKVLSISQNRIGIQRVFDRPVAIGFRGFDFSVLLDAKTGKYLGAMEILGITESSMGRGK